jgi:tetratricopeptide (TPR) repeat protein
MGELGVAGELASSTVPSWAKRLAGLTTESFGEKDIETVGRLAEAWRLTGSAAAQAGDIPKAERYLDAAWKLAYPPEAALALGNIRERQDRLAEAVELWSIASSFETWKPPADLQERIEAACRKLPESAPGHSLPSEVSPFLGFGAREK